MLKRNPVWCHIGRYQLKIPKLSEYTAYSRSYTIGRVWGWSSKELLVKNNDLD